jgi:hypothetical protein
VYGPHLLLSAAQLQRLLFFAAVVERMGSLVRVLMEIIKASVKHALSGPTFPTSYARHQLLA